VLRREVRFRVGGGAADFGCNVAEVQVLRRRRSAADFADDLLVEGRGLGLGELRFEAGFAEDGRRVSSDDLDLRICTCDFDAEELGECPDDDDVRCACCAQCRQACKDRRKVRISQLFGVLAT
jgi:hypothetical protein